MSIVLGIITFAVFYADMIWMNCIYPEMYKGKKDQEEIEAKSKFFSVRSIIILAIVIAITYFANLSKIVLFASSASLAMSILKYLSFTKFIKKLKKEDTDYFDDYNYDYSFSNDDYDEYGIPGNIFEEYDDEYGEDEDSTFKEYDGNDEESCIEITDEDDIDDDEIVDIIDGKIYN